MLNTTPTQFIELGDVKPMSTESLFLYVLESPKITCSWNSGGIGKKHGFEMEEILLVAHGGWHNDTIVVVERKIK